MPAQLLRCVTTYRNTKLPAYMRRKLFLKLFNKRPFQRNLPRIDALNETFLLIATKNRAINRYRPNCPGIDHYLSTNQTQTCNVFNCILLFSAYTILSFCLFHPANHCQDNSPKPPLPLICQQQICIPHPAGLFHKAICFQNRLIQ